MILIDVLPDICLEEKKTKGIVFQFHDLDNKNDIFNNGHVLVKVF